MENEERPVSCKLTTPDLQKRKIETIQLLKKALLERKELSNCYSYKFDGSDIMIQQIIAFILTERLCCNFFTFQLIIEDELYAWLFLTGPEGAKILSRANLISESGSLGL
jgi:hypothetical protein